VRRMGREKRYLIAIFKFATLFCTALNRHYYWRTVMFAFYCWTNFHIGDWQSFGGVGGSRKLTVKYISKKQMVW